MKTIKKFDIGSRVFFNNFDDYVTKDIDELHIMDSWIVKGTNVLNLNDNGLDIFYFKNMSKEEFINDTLQCETSMRVGKFLVPEFVEYINFTIDDLKKLEIQFNKIDDKHKYEKIIYDAYIKNNEFKLTEEQLKAAYKEYKKYRT